MSNFSEIIHVESLRKQLLSQIKVLDTQIANLNQSVNQKGLEINLSQIENANDIAKYRNELKASEIELALLQKWLELLNSGIDPKSIDLEQLRLDVIENAQLAQDRFEKQFLDLQEMVVNEGIIAISNRLGKQFFSPNLHPDIFRDEQSLEAQLRLNATMSETELAGSVFTDIFPKTLKQLLKSSKLNEGQIIAINKLLKLYNPYIEKGNLSDDQLLVVLMLIKSDENLKLIFKQSQALKPLLNATLKEIILDIELPEGKSVNELKDIIIRKKSEIAFLQKRLEAVDEISTKEGQSKILDINEQYFVQIQELKSQIESLNLQIRDKIQSMNLQYQQAAKDSLEVAKSSLENVFVNSAESVEPDTGAIVIQNARNEIINNNFEAEQQEYKEKFMALPGLIYEKFYSERRIGNVTINEILIKNNTETLYSSNHEINVSRNRLWLKALDNSQVIEWAVLVNASENYIDVELREIPEVSYKQLAFEKNVVKQKLEFYFNGDQSLKNAYNRVTVILKRDFDIDIDNLQGNSQIAETPKNDIESQEQLVRQKYEQIRSVFNTLKQKAEAGELGVDERYGKVQQKFGKTFVVNNLRINIPTNLLNIYEDISINNNRIYYTMNPTYDFDDMNISKYQLNEDISSNYEFKIPSQDITNSGIIYPKPTLEQLNSFYSDIKTLLIESGIELQA